MRQKLGECLGRLYIGSMRFTLPVLPVMASLVFGRIRYLREYRATLQKLRVHIDAMAEGPARHYFSDVMGTAAEVPVEIRGSCVQCGNCCMNHRCVFLEKQSETTYACGIYHSPFRRWSNCSSFPLNRRDIERYACPSYYAVDVATIQFVPGAALPQPPKAALLRSSSHPS